MKRLRELTIMTPNKPGKLSEVLRALAGQQVNLQAIDSSSGYDLNLVRLVTTDPARARKVLAQLGYQPTEAEVLAVTVLDRPGQLARITSAFGRGKVNIDYMYATAGAADALVIFHVSDLAAAERILRRLGWQ